MDPTSTNAPLASRREQILLQAGHRLASVSAFLLIAAAASSAMGKPHGWIAGSAMATALAAIALALWASRLARAQFRPAAEAMGIFLFGLVCALPAGVLCLLFLLRHSS